ncbi:putative ATP-BINDING CASSETTE TRANSPORTER, partial [Babesia divergens]
MEERQSSVNCEATSKTNHKLEATYYDDAGFFSKVFFLWIRFWVYNVHHGLFEARTLHPLPRADRISYWQPIFSKHISDGLLRLEKAQHDKAVNSGDATKPYSIITVRALFLTFGWNVGILLLATAIMNVINVGMSIVLKIILDTIASKGKSFAMIVLYVLAIAIIELSLSIMEQHVTFYNCRMEALMEATISITLFQHGMCHRRAYSSATDGCSVMEGCKGVVHSWPCEDSGCSSNPLKCPARRHQNKELSPSMYTHLMLDTYAMMAIVEAMLIGIKFITTLIASFVTIRVQLGAAILPTLLVVSLVVLITVFLEIANGCVYMHSMQSKDYRYAQAADTVGNIDVIRGMGIDDTCYNAMHDSRCDELSVLMTRVILQAFNGSTMKTLSSIIFLIILLDYINDVKSTVDYTSFDVGAPITLLFIVSRITKATENLPKSVKVIMEATTSIKRVEAFIRRCSPNYYFGSGAKTSNSIASVEHPTKRHSTGISGDTVVMYKGATFAWIESREEILNPSERRHPILRDVDFEVKRGDIKIITGNQGCG